MIGNDGVSPPKVLLCPRADQSTKGQSYTEYLLMLVAVIFIIVIAILYVMSSLGG